MTTFHDIPQQALRDLVAVSHGRAVEALGQMTNSRFVTDEPVVTIEPSEEFDINLSQWIRGEFAVVSQEFFGPIAVNALFLLDKSGANLVTAHLSADAGPHVSEREIIAEVGNIFLNACLGVFGNELRVHLGFAVPKVELRMGPAERPDHGVPGPDVTYVLVVRTAFSSVGQATAEGRMVVILGLAPLDRLRSYLEGKQRGG